MTDSNRTRLAGIVESTLGTLPATPRLRTMRITGESLRFTPQTLDSAEFRSDRMTSQPIQIFQQNSGGVNYEFSYPTWNSLLSDMIQSAMFNTWVSTPFRDNDGTADNEITDIGSSPGVATVLNVHGAFVVGHLLYNSGFTTAANNGLFPVTTGGTTSVTSAGSGWVAEPVPPAAARIKVVGFQGTAGDITATSTGLGSTALNLTTLGLSVGQWLKVGGTGANFRFTGTAANNDWARITAITATALTLDNRPSGWGVDPGAGKTIRVFFGDGIINGTTRISLSLEKGFLGQTTPTYVVHNGMVVNTMTVGMQSRQAVSGTFDFIGTAAAVGTVANGTTYDAVTSEAILATNVSVGRIAEAGSTVIGPNWIRNFTINLTNNLRPLDAVGFAQAVDIGSGEAGVTGTIDTYFGSNAIYAKLINATVTSINARAQAGTRATIWTLPAVLLTDGSPNATAKNTDVMISAQYRAFADSATNSEVRLDRFDYYEA
jgi:hypothetical protein